MAELCIYISVYISNTFVLEMNALVSQLGTGVAPVPSPVVPEFSPPLLSFEEFQFEADIGVF